MRIATDDNAFGIFIASVAAGSDHRFFRFQLIVSGEVVGDDQPCILGSTMGYLDDIAQVDDARLGNADTDPGGVLAATFSDADLHDRLVFTHAESIDGWVVIAYQHGDRSPGLLAGHRLRATDERPTRQWRSLNTAESYGRPSATGDHARLHDGTSVHAWRIARRCERPIMPLGHWSTSSLRRSTTTPPLAGQRPHMTLSSVKQHPSKCQPGRDDACHANGMDEAMRPVRCEGEYEECKEARNDEPAGIYEPRLTSSLHVGTPLFYSLLLTLCAPAVNVAHVLNSTPPLMTTVTRLDLVT